MGKESLEIALVKYNKKTWCKSGLLGVFIGLAAIVPGISGSTAAIIFKLYDQFLYAISNLFKKFKQCFIFLLPILIGIVIGVVGGFIAIKQLLKLLPFGIICLFAGLMSGAAPAVKDEIKVVQYNAKRISLFCVGLILPIIMGATSAILTITGGGVHADAFVPVQWWQPILGVVFGAFVGLTQIMPGLSASAFMMAVGWFTNIVESISLSYWQLNPQIFIIYGALIFGFFAGVFCFSKLLTRLLTKHRSTTYTFIFGLSIGSILAMFCNSDIIDVYYAWKTASAGNIALNVVLGVVLFVGGAIGAYMLVRYQRKKDAEKAKAEEQEETPALTEPQE